MSQTEKKTTGMPEPTDEERGKLSNLLFTIYNHGTLPNAYREADVILAAGFRLTETRYTVEQLAAKLGDGNYPDRNGGYVADYLREAAHEGLV